MILAGDIGAIVKGRRLTDWLAGICKDFKKVVFDCGNNEFKSGGRSRGHAVLLEEARGWVNLPEMRGKLVCMDDTRHDLDDGTGEKITILGTTLWSWLKRPGTRGGKDIDGNNEIQHKRRYERSYMLLANQISHIRKKEEGGKPRRILVITHHAPTVWRNQIPDKPFNEYLCQISYGRLE